MREFMYYGEHPTGGCYGFFENASDCKNPQELTIAEYNKLFEDQAKGLQITPDKNGRPIAVDPESLLTAEQKKERKAEQVRARRDELLKDSDVQVVIDRWEAKTSEEKKSWTEYRQYLRDIPEQPNFPYDKVKTFEEYFI